MVCALGKTPEEGWDVLLSGKTGIGPIEGFDAGGFACTSAAQIRDLNVTELGDTRGLALKAIAARFVGNTITGADLAPDGLSAWTYELTPTPAPAPTAMPAPPSVKPVFGAVTTVPATPVAGNKIVFTLAVKRSDTEAPLTTGTMTCDPSVGGIIVKHTESFTSGKVRLSFVVPRTAKGRLLKVKVKITNGAQSATKVVTYKVT